MHLENAAPEDLWVFAYGSLMWRPDFPFLERRPGRLIGAHRALCVFSHVHRGTPEKPGLVLGLDLGGACRGIAYRVQGANADKVMAYLWDREMVTRAYRCHSVTIHLATGPVKARAFIVDRKHKQYAGKLPPEKLAALICQGHGQRGPCRAYLENTVKHLDQLGVPDKRLHELLQKVRALSA